jgi:hypothetical protein
MAGNVLHEVRPKFRAIICLYKCGVACDPLDLCLHKAAAYRQCLHTVSSCVHHVSQAVGRVLC